MTRKTKYTYTVKKNERVTFTINPINGATGKVTAAQNGNPLPDTGGTKPRFSFRCDEFFGNSHFCMIEFTFLKDDPSKAEFELVLTSSEGDRFDDFSNIKKKNSGRERNLRFIVQK